MIVVQKLRTPPPAASFFGHCSAAPLGGQALPELMPTPVRTSLLAGMLAQLDGTRQKHGMSDEISSRKSPAFHVESQKKFAPIFVSFCVLS